MGYTSTTSVVTHAPNVTRPRHYHNTWSPQWSTYPLKVMLGFDLEVVNISPGWDDEYLVTRLKEAHDKLRGISRRIFSFKSVTHLQLVQISGAVYVPPRTICISPYWRWRVERLFAHHTVLRGERTLLREVTQDSTLGLQFVEEWQLWRVGAAMLTSAGVSLLSGFVYGIISNDWNGASNLTMLLGIMLTLLAFGVGFALEPDV